MAARRIAEAWEAFAAIALPAGLTHGQRRSARNTFYAGAMACFQAMMGAVGPDPGGDVSAADLEGIADIDNEIRDFMAAAIQGAAASAGRPS